MRSTIAIATAAFVAITLAAPGTPTLALDALASDHIRALPRTARTLLRVIGATDRRGAGLASYLLFEPPYTRALIELGRIDTFARRDDVRRFFASNDSTTNGP